MSWKRNDSKDSQATTQTPGTMTPARSDSLPPRPVNVATKPVNLGKSIKISGELSGNEEAKTARPVVAFPRVGSCAKPRNSRRC